jgi:Flp pilus assembly protein TadD
MSDGPSERWDEICKASDSVALQIELLRAFVRDFPDQYVACAMLGDRLSDISCFDEAKPFLQRALETSPPSFLRRIHSMLGHHFRDRGDFGEAERWFRSSIELEPTEAEARIFLGAMLARLGRLDEAEALHRRATACLTGAVDEAYLNLGYVLRARGRYEEALECFERAMTLDPQYKLARLAARDVRNAIAARARHAVRDGNSPRPEAADPSADLHGVDAGG